MHDHDAVLRPIIERAAQRLRDELRAVLGSEAVQVRCVLLSDQTDRAASAAGVRVTNASIGLQLVRMRAPSPAKERKPR